MSKQSTRQRTRQERRREELQRREAERRRAVRTRPLRRTKWGIELPRRAKKRKIFSSKTFSERIILLMSSHDTPGVDSHQASAAYTHMIEEISDLVLQASGLGQEPRPDQLGQIQQDEAIPRGRGRPQQVSGTQLWSS